MRVLLVAQGYPPRDLGGTEVHTAAVADVLASRGNMVSVFAGSPSERRRDRRAANELHGDVPVRRVTGGPDAGTINLRDAGVRAEFERTLDGLAPDVVHVQHLMHLSGDLIEAASGRGVPVVATLHDLWFQCPATHLRPEVRHPFAGRTWGLACAWHHELHDPKRSAKLAGRGRLPRALLNVLSRPEMMRRQLGLASELIVPSRFVRDAFIRFGVSEQALRLLPHGTGVEPLHGSRTFGSPTRFGFVGSIVPIKGIGTLCRAFSRAGGDSTLHLYGAVPDPRFLRQLLERSDGRVRYEGDFASEDAASVYDSFDVLVAPSVVGESFGLTAVEAQARGLPVIASRVGALPDRVRHGRDGLLVPAGDPRALEQALSRLRDPGEVRRLAAGVRRPKPMSLYVRELEAIYNEVASRHGADAAPLIYQGGVRHA